jgi:hypothetical protein
MPEIISAAQMVVRNQERLPSLKTSVSCGNCGRDADFDDGAYHCYPCRLDFDPDPFSEKEATFFDEDDKVCGAVPDDIAVDLGTNTKRQSWWPARAHACNTAMTNDPCTLPEEHEKGEHYHPHGWLYTFFDADGLALEDD